MTHVVHFVAGISSFEFMIDERIRFGDEWTFKSTIEVFIAKISCYYSANNLIFPL